MSSTPFIRLKKWAAAAAAATAKSVKDASSAAVARGDRLSQSISSPIAPAEERGHVFLGLCLSFATFKWGSSKGSVDKREEGSVDKREENTNELVTEVRLMREGINGRLDSFLEAKEKELKIMKENGKKTWFAKFW